MLSQKEVLRTLEKRRWGGISRLAGKTANDAMNHIQFKQQYEKRLEQLLFADVPEGASTADKVGRWSTIGQKSEEWRQLLDEDSQKPRPLLEQYDRQAVFEVLRAHYRSVWEIFILFLLLCGVTTTGVFKLFYWATAPKKGKLLGDDERSDLTVSNGSDLSIR